MTSFIKRGLATLSLAAVAACSSGGAHTLPLTPAASGAGSTGTASATLKLKRLVQRSSSANTRRPQELSYGANSVIVDATQNGAAVLHTVIDFSGIVINTMSCGSDSSGMYLICSTQVRLPLGTSQVTVTTNSARDGSGQTLGKATVPVTVVAGQDNPINMTLDGVPASVRVAVSDPAPLIGTAVTLPVTTQVYDAGGFVFVAPQNYANAVSLTDSDTSTHTALYTQAVQNSTQVNNGTPAPSATTTPGKSASIPDRYTQAYLTYDGTAISPFTVTATVGTLPAASVTVSPASGVTRNAGTSPATHDVTGFAPSDVIFDTSGNLWAVQSNSSGAKVVAVSASTYTSTATYSLGNTSRRLVAPAIGPDGAIWMASYTVSAGAIAAPYYVTRFDPVAGTFTDYPTTARPNVIAVAGGNLWAVERNGALLWKLPFTSGAVSGAASEIAVGLPPQTDTSSPAAESLPDWIGGSSDGNLWLLETSYAALNGTWLVKVDQNGNKIANTETLVLGNAGIQDGLVGQAIDASGKIWCVSTANANEIVRIDTASANSVTTYVVPHLAGFDAYSGSHTHAYTALDPSGDLWFEMAMDNRIGRVDATTGRVDLFGGAPSDEQSTSGMAVNSSLLVVTGVHRTGVGFLFTLNATP